MAAATMCSLICAALTSESGEILFPVCFGACMASGDAICGDAFCPGLCNTLDPTGAIIAAGCMGVCDSACGLASTEDSLPGPNTLKGPGCECGWPCKCDDLEDAFQEQDLKEKMQSWAFQNMDALQREVEQLRDEVKENEVKDVRAKFDRQELHAKVEELRDEEKRAKDEVHQLHSEVEELRNEVQELEKMIPRKSA